MHVEELLEQKLAGVEQKVEELQKLEHSLKAALRKCKRGLKTTSQAMKTVALLNLPFQLMAQFLIEFPLNISA